MNKPALTVLSALTASLACYVASVALYRAPTVAAAARTQLGQDPDRGLRTNTGITASDLDLRVTPVVKAVRQTQDSVVSIYLVNGTRMTRSGEMITDGQGSGVVLDESGLVITNWHVVAPAVDDKDRYRVQARFPGGKNLMANVLSSSPAHDLALLQLELAEDQKVQPMILGDSSTLMIGEPVIAIGNPRGHANTVTVGVLSATDRTIRVQTPDRRLRTYAGLLQTDAAINQGNSGGALLDITGKLIGINNAMAVGAENIGFAIPVNTVKEVFQTVLLSAENIASVWLGMRVVDRDGAAVVVEVDPRGPAAEAGVREDDQLVTVNGQSITTALDYARRVLDARPGRPFPLQLRRGTRSTEASPVPRSAAEWELLRRVGLRVESIAAEADPALIRRATREFYSGSGRRRVALLPAVLRVVSVEPGGPAADIDLEPGDLILGLISGDSFWGARTIPLPTVEHLADVLRVHAGRRATMIVMRGDDGYVGDLFVRRL